MLFLEVAVISIMNTSAEAFGPPVVFLDMDGVLTWSRPDISVVERFMSGAMDNFNTIIERTRARVVVSSSWREGATVDQLNKWLWIGGFAGNVFDVTPVHRPSDGFADSLVRAGEIEVWLDAQELRPAGVVVLDDMRIGGRLWSHSVLTDARYGLTSQDAERAVAILGNGPVERRRTL